MEWGAIAFSWAIAVRKIRGQKDATIVTSAAPLSQIKWDELGNAGGHL